MKREDAIDELLTHIEGVVPSVWDVRLDGPPGDDGTDEVEPPEVIVDVSETRQPNHNGHSSFGGYITDDNGNHTGIEHHAYWRMDVDVTARAYDELDKDRAVHDIQMSFVPYERDATQFDRDTAEWEVGEHEPRYNAVMEPDWYESGFMVRFLLLKRYDETGKDTIDTIQKSVDVDQTLGE